VREDHLDAAEHAQTMQLWRELRVHRLRSPGGWLTLVDRVLLDEGENELAVGTITLRHGVARLRARPGVTLGGRKVDERVLRSDEGGPADALVFEGRTYELFRRGDAFAVRVKDPQAPALLGFAGLDYYPADLAWRIEARWEAFSPPRQTRHQFDIGAGWVREVPGLAHFEVGGRAVSLEPVRDEDGRRLFFVFGDETNRDETYPGGRFLYADLPRSGLVVLDFNTAFNPPCVFTPYATCPATPPHNQLPFPVHAGEKRYPSASPQRGEAAGPQGRG
jgi:uncharacterized protein (DUF1684 family)